MGTTKMIIQNVEYLGHGILPSNKNKNHLYMQQQEKI